MNTLLWGDDGGGQLFKVGDVYKDVFRVESFLRGGMGEVYICQMIQNVNNGFGQFSNARCNPPAELANRKVVLKTFGSQVAGHRASVDRFQREAEIWITLLPHPNIVRAQSVDRVGWSLVLWLEYIDGGNLRQRMRSTGMPLEEVLCISMQVCAGMEFLRTSANIVHRDLKPENILLTSSGITKITDFGIAKARNLVQNPVASSDVRKDIQSNLLTGYGAALGTLPYMSPEQFSDAQSATTESDIYAFGMVLYEMVTGHLPFSDRSVEEWRTRHTIDAPSPPLHDGRFLGLNRVVLRCLEKKKEHRFQDFGGLSSALNEICTEVNLPNLIPPKVTQAEVEGNMSANDWSQRGYGFSKLGMDKDCYECYTRAVYMDPDLPGIHVNLGSVLSRLGRLEDAQREFEKAVQLQPEAAIVHSALGKFYGTQGRWRDAAACFRKAVELYPEGPSNWREYLRVLREINSAEDPSEENLAASNQIVQLAEAMNDPRLIDNEAIQCAQQGDLDLAVRLHILCQTRFPVDAKRKYNSAITWHRMAVQRRSTNQKAHDFFESAVRSYSEALKIQPRMIRGLICRGLAYAALGDGPQAIADLESATLLEPEHEVCQMFLVLLPVLRMFRLESGPNFIDRLIAGLKAATLQTSGSEKFAANVKEILTGNLLLRYE